MRWLVLALVFAFGFATFVVVAAVTSGPPKDPDAFEYHLPETDEEQEVARVATDYVRRLIRRRELYERTPLEVTNVGVRENGTASVWFSGLEPGPGHSVSLRRVGGRWRAVDHTAFGLA